MTGGYPLERFGDVGGQMAQIVRAAARASLGGRDHDLLARQVSGQVPARGPLAGEGSDRRGLCGCNLPEEFGFAGIRLEFLEGQLQLVAQAAATLGARAKFVTAHLLIHQLEIGVARQQVGIDRPNLGHFSSASRA